MTKQINTVLALLLLSVALPAQIRLNVAGDAQINGMLKLLQGEDNIIVGANAGAALTTGAITDANERTVIGRNEAGVVIGGYAYSLLLDGQVVETRQMVISR